MKYKGHPHNPDHYRFRRTLPGAPFEEPPEGITADDVFCGLVYAVLIAILLTAPWWAQFLVE